MEIKKIINKKVTLNIIKLIITLIFIGFLVNYLTFKGLFISLSKINLFYLFIVVLLMPINLYLQFKRWQMLCISYEKSSNKTIIKSLFIGIAGGLITPFKAGEFLGRAYIFEHNKRKTYALLTVYDKLLSIFVTFILGMIISIFTFINTLNVFLQYVLPILAISLIVIYLIKLVLQKRFKQKYDKIINTISEIYSIIKINKNLKLVFLAFALFITYVTQFALLLSSFNNIKHFINYILAGVLVFFTNTIIPPFTFGELGIRESAAVFYSDYFNYLPDSGFNAAILLFFINVIIPSIIGLFIYLREK